jgi:hypothetical protein
MTKKIFEELPARKHAPAKAAPAAEMRGEKKGGAEGEVSEKRIRQAVYDIRYRARREGIDLRAAFAQYMQNSNLSAPEQAAVRAKLFGKDGGGDKKESYDAMMTDSAYGVVANALFKVFVEKNQPEEEVYEEANMERKYKVRVTDPKNDRSYVRYATREKITQLRAKGLKVEMTEHGEPYEGKKKKEVPNNRSGLDRPVHPSKRDGDVNDDGKKDGTDRYIYNRRDAINKAIKMRKEEFLVSEAGTTSTEGQNKDKITGTGVDNYSTGVVKVNPETESGNGKMRRMRGLYAHTELNGEVIAENAYSKFMTMLNEKAVSEQQQKLFGLALSVKRGQTPRSEASDEVLKIVDKMSEEEIRKYAKTSHEGLPEKKEMKEEMGGTCEKCGKCPCECDKRDAKTYRDLLKNKIRSMGIKNPIMLGDYDEKVMKLLTKNDDATRMMVSGGTLGGPMMGSMKAESCGGTHSTKKKKKKGY